jgi:hypothetical protein
MMTDGDEDESASQENGDMEPEEHVETIEKVMESRMGKKGGRVDRNQMVIGNY